jgi:dTDP-4-dehydrorhamnose reductase
MTRILLFGKNGQLGWEFQRTLPLLGELTKVDADELDLTDENGLSALIRATAPQIIVNASAYTAVDKAETEADLAHAINARAPQIMSQEALRLNALLVHFSTDYVFDGAKSAAYTENDTPNPLNAYGRGKLAGEQAIQRVGGHYFIFRTSWVYSLRRDSFVTKVLQWAAKNPELRIVDDQLGSPTWARMLSQASTMALGMAQARGSGWLDEVSGLYHLAGAGGATRFEWAQAILAESTLDVRSTRIIPAKTDEFPTPARRPLATPLDCARFERVFGLKVPGWRETLKLAMDSSNG